MAEEKKKPAKKRDYTYAVGRRKTATARVRLYEKKTVPGSEHSFVVNGVRIAEYFPGTAYKAIYERPFNTSGVKGISVSAKVEGSGKSSQLDAVVHGVARAIAKLDSDKYRPSLKQAGLLTRDPRKKQRRMVGTGGKARRQKQSPKR